MTNIEIRITGPVYLNENPRENLLMSTLLDAVNALVAEDNQVQAALTDLKNKAANQGSVSAADVQSATDTINQEIGKLKDAVSQNDPTPEPAPVPAPSPEPSPAPEPTPAPEPVPAPAAPADSGSPAPDQSATPTPAADQSVTVTPSEAPPAQ